MAVHIIVILYIVQECYKAVVTLLSHDVSKQSLVSIVQECFIAVITLLFHRCLKAVTCIISLRVFYSSQ